MSLCVQASTPQKKDGELRQSTLQQELHGRLSLSLQQLKLAQLLQVWQPYKVIGIVKGSKELVFRKGNYNDNNAQIHNIPQRNDLRFLGITF